MSYFKKVCSFIARKKEEIQTIGQTEIEQLQTQIDQIQKVMFRDIPEPHERQNMQSFSRFHNISGGLRSTAEFSKESKLSMEVYFHHREKAEVALTAGSSWYGGDYFEFGSHDLATFRNMLSAYDICAMTRNYQDVRFYAFDIFGDPTVNAPEKAEHTLDEDFTSAFAHYMTKGDQIKLHEEFLDQHNLFRDKCFLVQGLFENTLTNEFKTKYQSEDRKIGFAFLDCNIAPSYKTVFEFIFDMMAEHSYIYMDEYLQGPSTLKQYSQFVDELREKRNMGSVYIRNAGGFGGLFRLYPLGKKEDYKLNFIKYAPSLHHH